MSELKPCPFCGSTDIRLIAGDEYCWCMNQCCPIYDYEIRIDKWESRSESTELTTLREQVKVLREALEACIDLLSNLENIGGFVGLAVINNGQTALDQTKPKDGERC